MKNRGINPVLVELVVVILFFALSSAVIVQALGTANRISTQSSMQSAALVALEDMAERIKSDPENCPFDGDTALWQTEYGRIVCSAVVTREAGAHGAYYSIELTALNGGEVLLTLDAARYMQSGVTP